MTIFLLSLFPQDTGSGVLPEGVHLRPSLSCFAEGSLLPRGLFLRSAVFAMSDAEPTAAGRSLTEDEMAEVKKEVLERLRRYLCDKIIAERHFDYLRSKKILSREDTEEISCRTSSRKKAGKLLDYLAEHPKGLDTLIESIKCEKTQNFLLEKITDAVLKAKNEKLESLKGSRCNNCMASLCEQASNLSRSQSNDSIFFEKQRDRENTYLHPEEYSTAAFVSASSLCSMNLPITEVGNMENSVFSTLPGPGDPGAPPVPTELQSEQEEISTTSSDNPFLPLRSRSILP